MLFFNLVGRKVVACSVVDWDKNRSARSLKLSKIGPRGRVQTIFLGLETDDGLHGHPHAFITFAKSGRYKNRENIVDASMSVSSATFNQAIDDHDELVNQIWFKNREST